MPSDRRLPCLIGPYVRPAVSGRSVRPLIRHAGLMIAFFLLSSEVRAQERDPQQAALDDFVAARMLTNKCPSWQIDLAGAHMRFAQLNLRPADWQEGGRYAGFFEERLSYYGSLLSRMPEARICGAAEEAFGPNGSVRKGWMKRQG